MSHSRSPQSGARCLRHPSGYPDTPVTAPHRSTKATALGCAPQGNMARFASAVSLQSPQRRTRPTTSSDDDGPCERGGACTAGRTEALRTSLRHRTALQQGRPPLYWALHQKNTTSPPPITAARGYNCTLSHLLYATNQYHTMELSDGNGAHRVYSRGGERWPPNRSAAVVGSLAGWRRSAPWNLGATLSHLVISGCMVEASDSGTGR